MSLYDTAVDQIKGAQQKAAVVCHLAEVTSLSEGKAYVQFYGESSPSAKLYPYIEGYKPTIGDQVLMMAQGSTYVIIGKISKANITDNYYLEKSEADTLYMSSGTSLATDKLTSGTDTLTLTSGKVVQPSGNKTFALGDSSHVFKEARIETVYADAADITVFAGQYRRTYNDSSKGYVEWTANNELSPSGNGSVSLGKSNRAFNNAFINNLIGAAWASASGSAYSLSYTSERVIAPSQTKMISLGSSSKQLNDVYAKQFYQDGTAISTSDKRKKKNIKDITQKYVEFFRNLKPRLFKFKDGDSGRTHLGFIAQEVEEAAGAAGIDNQDLAFLCIDETGNYGLRYEELIALQTQIIQDLLIRVEKLENERSTKA